MNKKFFLVHSLCSYTPANIHKQLNADISNMNRILTYIIEIILIPLPNIHHYSNKYIHKHKHLASHGSFWYKKLLPKKTSTFYNTLVINKLIEIV